MKNFTEYLNESEELEVSRELNEDFMSAATSVLGYSVSGLLIAWGGYLIIKGYSSLGSKLLSFIRKNWSKLFIGKKQIDSTNAQKLLTGIKTEIVVKNEAEKTKREKSEFDEKMSAIFEAVKEKDSDKTIQEIKNYKSNLSQKEVRVLISEIVEAFEEPPIHYGNTGNECYMFIKKVLGIKTAQVVAKLVKQSLSKKASELLIFDDGNIEKESN